MTADSGNTRKRKDVDKDHTDQDSDGSNAKKSRVVWSVDLHQKFVNAVNQIGFDSKCYLKVCTFIKTFYKIIKFP